MEGTTCDDLRTTLTRHFSQTVVALRSDNRNKARSFRACTDASLRQLSSVKEKGLYVAEASKGSRQERIAIGAAWTA